MAFIAKYAFRGDCTIETADLAGVKIATVTGPCYYCRTPQAVLVPADNLEKFKEGGYAQDCFAELTADQREFLISGICGECWDKMFSEVSANE